MDRNQIEPLVSGALIVLAGSAVALWLPPGLSGGFMLLALLRICWIEDNIRADLMPASKVPAGYRRTQEAQARWRGLLNLAQPEDITCPLRLASRLRVQAHAWHAVFLACVGAAIATLPGLSPPAALGLGLLCLGGAFMRVDRVVAAEGILRRQSALPREMLDDRGLLARYLCNRGPGM